MKWNRFAAAAAFALIAAVGASPAAAAGGGMDPLGAPIVSWFMQLFGLSAAGANQCSRDCGPAVDPSG